MGIARISAQAENTQIAVDLDTIALASIAVNGQEFMHNGKKPGWPHTEKVCSPVFGPTKQADYQVSANGILYPMDQHGISPLVPRQVESHTHDTISLIQEYDGSLLTNPKFSGKPGQPTHVQYQPSTTTMLYTARKDGIVAVLGVHNTGDQPLPFNLAWHPAFKNFGSPEKGIFVREHGTPIATLLQIVNNPIVIANTGTIAYENQATGQNIILFAPQYERVALWTNHESMFCMEPILHDPKNPELGMKEVLATGEKGEYRVEILINN